MSTTITVRTQAEADEAFTRQTREGSSAVKVVIASTAGVWIKIPAGGRADVNSGGRAAVNSGGRAAVNSGGRAAVNSGGRADVNSGGRADVNSGGRADVNDGGRADVNSGGRADARAASTLNLFAGSSAHAGPFTAVFLHSQKVTLDGDGNVIDLSGLDLNDPRTWCDYHGVDVVDGIAYVHKAVDQEFRSHHGADYTPGSTPEAPDWNTRRECGGGLHFGATPSLALEHAAGYIAAPRWLKCGVRLDEMVCLGDKVKARRVVQACVEVDVTGDVTAAVVSGG
jgi:hypothetical protein